MLLGYKTGFVRPGHIFAFCTVNCIVLEANNGKGDGDILNDQNAESV